MSWLRGWSDAVLSLLRKAREERDTDEEMRFHLERAAEANMRAGMTPMEARRAAAHAFGAVERFKEEVRDARGARLADDAAQDVVYGLRSLRKNPGFAAVAVLTLGLGIGAMTAVFGAVNGVLLDPLPYPDADRLMLVLSRYVPESGYDFPSFSVSPPEYFDYRQQSRSMEDVAAFAGLDATLMLDDGTPVRLQAGAVTADLFKVLAVAPALGRGFMHEEDAPGGEPVVVLSHGLWQSAYGGDDGVIGRTIRLDAFRFWVRGGGGSSVRVVGVMPEGFAIPGQAHELWLPLGLDPESKSRGFHFLSGIGRLRSGVSRQAAEAELSVLMSQWKAAYPDVHTGHFLFMQPMLESVVGDVRGALLVLLGAVGFVLLIVCANVANLLLARGERRQREVAVRGALGAGRGRLARQLLTESVLLSALGSALGLILAYLGVRAMVTLGSGSIPRADNIGLDARVVAFTAFVGLTVAAAFGGVPALRAAAVRPLAALCEGGRGGTSGRRWSRFRAVLATLQVTLAFLLAVAGGLMIRSFRALVDVDPGLRAENLLVATLSVPQSKYPRPEHVTGFQARLHERLRALPGVRAASATSVLPLHEGPGTLDFIIEHRAPSGPGVPATSADLIIAMPGFPETMGVAMVRGRFFEPSDRPDAAPVAVVSRSAARMFWPNEDPIGQRISFAGDDTLWLTVVGIIEDVKYGGLHADARQAWYIPSALGPLFGSATRTLSYALRTEGDPLALADAVRETVAELDGELPITRMQTMESVVSASVAQPRFLMTLLGLFGGLALVLGAIGLYGVLSYTVAQRSREMGIRMALGARRAETARLVIWQGLRLAAAGVLVGAALAFYATRVMSGLLFGVQPTDLRTFAVTTVVLVGVALVACGAPAWRAARVDPVALLRRE